MNTQITPGWKTSEFWLHLASMLGPVFSVVLGASNPATIAIAAAASLGASIYSASRTSLKGHALSTAVKAAQVAADAIAADAIAAGG